MLFIYFLWMTTFVCPVIFLFIYNHAQCMTYLLFIYTQIKFLNGIFISNLFQNKKKISALYRKIGQYLFEDNIIIWIM